MTAENAVVAWSETKVLRDEAEHVAKYVFKNKDAVAEAVLYRYPDFRTRTVICCSTQSGCPIGCRFCGAGDFFIRSLTADEIISQSIRCLQDIDCDPAEIGKLQIMFMSMGEPLLNMRAVATAIEHLHHLYPAAQLLVSTSAPRVDYVEIITLSQKVQTVGLQFSVHESTDDARNKLVPFKAKLSLAEISQVGERWFEEGGRRPFLNYCAHELNSTDDDANRLLSLFNPKVWCATVSVVCERNNGLPATSDYQRELATDFGRKLVNAGYDVRIFDPAGQDTVGGGCGQLWHVQQWVRENSEKAKSSIGANIPTRHVPHK